MGEYRSVSTPSLHLNNDDFEYETNEAKFFSEDDEHIIHSQRKSRLSGKRGKFSLRCYGTANGFPDQVQQDSLKSAESPGNGGEEKPPAKLKFCQLSSRSKYTLVLLATANFGAGCGFSLPAPFFPREAEKKGASETAIGLVFGSFQLVNFLACPVFGNYLTVLGAKFVFTSGIMVAGCTSILFGFLNKGPSGLVFVAMSFLVRCTEALGVAALSTAGYAIIFNEFPNHIGSVFAVLETCIGLGLMVGPTIGGALYEIGGFGMPFWVLGAAIMANGLAIFSCLPIPKDTTTKRQGTVFSLLKSSLVWVAMMCLMVGSCGVGFIDPTLSSHLGQFGLSTIAISLFFVIIPGMYAVTAPFWGYLTDAKDIQSPLLVGGCLVCTLGFMFMGPSPLFPFLPRELWTVTLGLVIYGLSVGCTIVPTMKCFVLGARDIGLQDNLNTFGLVSGMFNSTLCLGQFIGPTIGGTLVDQIGFHYGSTIIAGFYVVSMMVSGSYFVVRRIRKRSHSPENRVDQDTTKSTTNEILSNEKAPLKSTVTIKQGLDNSYSAAVNTQPEFTE